MTQLEPFTLGVTVAVGVDLADELAVELRRAIIHVEARRSD